MRKTLRDVAEKAGVSIAVVSRVLGNYGSVSSETRRKVLKEAKSIGYQPDIIARSMKTHRTHSLGVIISDITTFFFTSVVRGIEDVTSQNSYNVTLCNSDEDADKENSYLRELYQRKIDGLIISPTGENNNYLKKLIRAGLSVVLVDRRVSELQTTEVAVDNETGAWEAVKHLINLGHRRIGIVNGLSGIRTSEERFSGYKRALAEQGIPFDPGLVKYGDFRMDKGRQVAQEFLNMIDRPTAMFVANEPMTTGALLALGENKTKIPEEMAILGFDDPVWAPLLNPPLTTVRQPSYSIGTIAAQVLLQKIRKVGRGRSLHEEIVLKPKLMVRESCGEETFAARTTD